MPPRSLLADYQSTANYSFASFAQQVGRADPIYLSWIAEFAGSAVMLRDIVGQQYLLELGFEVAYQKHRETANSKKSQSQEN